MFRYSWALARLEVTRQGIPEGHHNPCSKRFQGEIPCFLRRLGSHYSGLVSSALGLPWLFKSMSMLYLCWHIRRPVDKDIANSTKSGPFVFAVS